MEKHIKQGNRMIVFLTLILFGCNQQVNNIRINSNVNSCVIDTTINNQIVINDSVSFNKYLLKGKKGRMYNDCIYFSSIDQKQYIRLQTNYGGGDDEYKEFEICYIYGDINSFIPNDVNEFFEINKSKETFSFLTSDIVNFTTESGIKLGISEMQLVHLLRNFKIDRYVNEDEIIYTYYSEECQYESTYIFENGKLVIFKFGYLTP